MSWLGRIRTYEALLKAECLPHPPFCYQPKFADYGTNQKVGGGGFEPPKLEAADLQSAPFDHSGNHHYFFLLKQPFEKRWGGLTKAAIILMERQ